MKCSALTKDNKPCKGTPLAGSEWCFSHHPDLEERRREGSAKGGSEKSNSARARRHFRNASLDAPDIHGLLSGALVQVSEGSMEPAVGNALAAMSKALVTIYESTLLTERIEQLEQAAGIAPDNVTPLRRSA